jgi:hypothetical protein
MSQHICQPCDWIGRSDICSNCGARNLNRIFDPYTPQESVGFFTRDECITMNLAFFRAMKAAVQSGGESKRNFTYGPKIDHTPLVGAYFDKPLRHSPMSSGANACLNMTLDTSRPAALPSVSFKTSPWK